MKKSIIALILLVSAPSLLGEQPTISVTGTATISVQPEVLRWETEFTNKGPSLEEVAKRHSESVSAVLSVIRNLGIKESDIQTPRSSFAENWEVVEKKRKMDGYLATTSINFSLDDTSLYSEVWIALSKFEGLRVSDTQWDITDQRRIEVREQSRLEAVKAAKRKAVLVADALNMEVGHPIKINEDRPNLTYSSLSGNYAGVVGDTGSSVSGFAAGTIDVSSTIYIEFSITSSH